MTTTESLAQNLAYLTVWRVEDAFDVSSVHPTADGGFYFTTEIEGNTYSIEVYGPEKTTA